jgi:carbon-monoxide dehydrogenase large subunit
MMAPGVYHIPRVETRALSVVTNTTPVGAYRGAGRPEATAALERAMDLFAVEVGQDPAAVCRVNLLPAFFDPRATATGVTYDSGNYVGALDRALDACG